MEYTKLFSKGKLGSLEVKNRIVMAPLAMGVADENQNFGEAFHDYLMERVNGGVGMIVIENTRVDDIHGVAANCQASVATDEKIASLTKMVKEIHEHNVIVFTQLHHPGRETFMNLNGNEPLWSSSSRSCGVCQQETHEMTTEEVEEVIQKFIDGAVRSQKAGCDGVELHGAHGYLISQFLSPYTNQRKDRFGGSFENRLNFVKEIVEGIFEECGKAFPVGIRLTVDELLQNNNVGEYLKLEDGIKVAKACEEMGMTYINVSNGIYESFNSLSEPMTYDQGCRTPLIRAIKDNVNIPIIAVNMVKEPWMAEKMLQDNLVDFVALGRAVVADPNWAKKAFEHREDEINRCISCTYCFETLVSDTIGGIGPVKCAVNPKAGRESIYKNINKNGDNRFIMVVGAGVSGLQCAKVLAERNFKVIVYEKDAVVGGQINIANKPPKKDKINWIVEYLMNQLNKLGVEVKTSAPVTKDLINSLHPYAVVVATGANQIKPSFIKGVEKENVYTIDQVLCSKNPITNQKVVLIGSGVSGLETAEFLCKNNNKLTIVEMQDSIGKGVYVQHYLDAMDILSKYDINYMPSNKLIEITDNGVITENVDTNDKTEITADVVVLSLGVRSENKLYNELKGSIEKVYIVGDASKTGRIADATRSAFELAYNLD